MNLKCYKCGLVNPKKLEDMKVLDLGSGSGREKAVVPNGHVELTGQMNR